MFHCKHPSPNAKRVQLNTTYSSVTPSPILPIEGIEHSLAIAETTGHGMIHLNLALQSKPEHTVGAQRNDAAQDECPTLTAS